VADDNEDCIILCDNLVKIYKTEETEVMALQGLDARIGRGELMAIIGNSGSGKSTFLNMIGGLDRPTAGRLYVDGLDLFRLSDNELVKYKRYTVGFIWQNNARNLLPYLPAWQNVQMPMLFSAEGGGRAGRERALELLDIVGLSHKKNSRLGELSGGEQQRVAIAIALANDPKILLADEPTGSVDSYTASYIFDTFRRLNRELGLTIVVVTHDLSVAEKVGRVVSIRGRQDKLREDHERRLRKQDRGSGLLQFRRRKALFRARGIRHTRQERAGADTGGVSCKARHKGRQGENERPRRRNSDNSARLAYTQLGTPG
jgi:ABC-type lipoprotein export system ATPase subunit